MSVIAPDVVAKIGLEDTSTQRIVGVTGTEEFVPVVQLPSVGFGAIELDPCRAAVIDVTRLGLPIDLILGVNAFGRRRVQFDFAEDRIYMIE